MTTIIIHVPAVVRASGSASVLEMVPAVSAARTDAGRWEVLVGRSTVYRCIHTRHISLGTIRCRSMVMCLVVAMVVAMAVDIRDDVTAIDGIGGTMHPGRKAQGVFQGFMSISSRFRMMPAATVIAAASSGFISAGRGPSGSVANFMAAGGSAE